MQWYLQSDYGLTRFINMFIGSMMISDCCVKLIGDPGVWSNPVSGCCCSGDRQFYYYVKSFKTWRCDNKHTSNNLNLVEFDYLWRGNELVLNGRMRWPCRNGSWTMWTCHNHLCWFGSGQFTCEDSVKHTTEDGSESGLECDLRLGVQYMVKKTPL